MWALSDGCRAVFGTVAPYALQYTLGLPPQLVPLIIFFYILTSTATLPLWFALSRRIDKAPAWRLALRCNALCFVPVLVAIHPAFIRLPEASVRIPFGCIFAGVVGACGGGTTCLALSLMGDVIDADSVSSGQSHHGLYFALWAFVSKTAGGLVTIVTGFSLELGGFVPNVAQDVLSRTTIGLLFTLPPLVGLNLAANLVGSFELDEEASSRVRAALAVRRRSERRVELRDADDDAGEADERIVEGAEVAASPPEPPNLMDWLLTLSAPLGCGTKPKPVLTKPPAEADLL